MYKVELSPEALEDYRWIAETQPPALLRRVDRLLQQLAVSPRRGIGHPHPLTGDLATYWGLYINDQHRIVYQIFDKRITVHIISMRGHYEGLKKRENPSAHWKSATLLLGTTKPKSRYFSDL